MVTLITKVSIPLNAMKVTLLGTGTSVPDPERVQSGILVESGDTAILIDVGSGVLHRLSQLKFDITKLEAVFISHFHIDHCSDFLTLMQSLWLSGYDRPLQLYAPPNVTEWSRGVRDIAFPYLREKLGLEIMKLKENDLVYMGPLTLATCPTTHGTMQTRAFKVEEDDFSFVFSSDTAPCREIANLASGTEVLIHECHWLDGNLPEGVHTSPGGLVEVVEKANPSKLILNHMTPEIIANSSKVLESVQRRTKATVAMGEDLMQFES
ncbi:MAG: MBL fold metallo-hydrolase [Promethearchaeota archaeon]